MLFKLGIKPALLLAYQQGKNRDRYTKSFLELSPLYPHMIFPQRNAVLYFQNQQVANTFWLSGIRYTYSNKQEKWICDYKSKELGLILGFPPAAVDFFENDLDYYGKSKRASLLLDYYGICFRCAVDDVNICLEWLYMHRPLPENLQEQPFRVGTNIVKYGTYVESIDGFVIN